MLSAITQTLSLISAGSLELDKLPFLFNKEQMSNCFLLKTSLGKLSIHFLSA